MKKLLLSFAALTLLWAGPALAQDAPAPEAPAPEAAEAPAVDDAPGTVADATATEAEKDLERDLALFWGRRREVKVVQKRMFEKDGRFELGLFSSIIPNDDFIMYYPLGARAAYHFSEAFAIEANFAYALDAETDLASFLESETGVGVNRATILETINMFYNVDILWSPIYGKINVMGMKLAHFETFAGVGVGMFHTTESPPNNPDGNDAVKPSGNSVLGFRWYITDLVNVRTEYRHHFFQKYEGGVSMPAELSLGVGFSI